jgi:hypothetical protein
VATKLKQAVLRTCAEWLRFTAQVSTQRSPQDSRLSASRCALRPRKAEFLLSSKTLPTGLARTRGRVLNPGFLTSLTTRACKRNTAQAKAMQVDLPIGAPRKDSRPLGLSQHVC